MARFGGVAMLVRAVGVLILLWGLTMVGYGVWLAIKFAGSATLYGSVLGLGAVNTIFAAGLLYRGYRSLFYLRLYGLVIGLLEIAQAAIAGLFFVQSQRDKIIDAANLPSDLRGQLESNLNVAGPALLAVVGLQLISLATVACQCLVVERTDPDEDETARTSLLATASKPKTGGAVASATATDAATVTAADRYKSKTSAYRQKYGIGEV